ncbi:MAG: hypothetical protein GKR88_20220 [Flavobacteriaceae bacterium]|nr:MAG: hypothetical protein GKR88_01635 [Flavobacteriaceae bacterium]QMU66384.1 MAG: hypothetical protein GKR88_20220 [Flavobacteriaceae bacterium]
MRDIYPTVKSWLLCALVITVTGTCILVTGQSLLRWHDSYLGSYMEHGKSLLNAKRNTQTRYPCKVE